MFSIRFFKFIKIFYKSRFETGFWWYIQLKPFCIVLNHKVFISEIFYCKLLLIIHIQIINYLFFRTLADTVYIPRNFNRNRKDNTNENGSFVE